MFGSKVIYEFENEFGKFSVEDLLYEDRKARILFSGPLHSAQSGVALDDNPQLLFDYIRLFLEIALQASPKRILVLGGGAMTLPRALAENLKDAKLTVVEINTELVAIAKKYFGFREDPRIRIVKADASKFMQLAKPTYDLIFTDLYNDFTIPPHFLSDGFAANLKHALLKGGLVATNCIAAPDSGDSPTLGKLVRSYSSQIGTVRAVKAETDYSDLLPQNIIVMSGDNVARYLADLPEIKLP